MSETRELVPCKDDDINADEFMRGQRDCINGIPHKSDSKDYDRGYAAQYELEQVTEKIS